MPKQLVHLSVLLGALGCSPPGTNPPGSADAGPSDGADRGDGAAAPLLTALDVAPSRAGRSSLVPPFSPTVFDYYVQCSTGSNSLVVSMSAAVGATSYLVQPKPTRASREQSVSLEVKENEAVVAVAADPKADSKTEYWVRCLPHDFPQMVMERHTGADEVPGGYYLVGTSQAIPGVDGYAIVLNGLGVPVWYVSTGRIAEGIGDVDSLEKGSVAFFRASQDLPVVIERLSPRRTTYARPEHYELDTHELRVLPDGNFLVLSKPIKDHVDLTGVNVNLPDGGAASLGPDSSMYDCRILEFEPMTGKVVWTWDANDHFDPKLYAAQSPADDVGGSLVVDPYHCNSLDVDPASQDVLVSSRNMSSIFYVERPSGKILWMLGGPCYPKDGASCVPLKDAFYRQHDARLSPGWSKACGTGQVSVFDDHSGRPGSARGLLLDVVTGAVEDGGSVDCGTRGGSRPLATVAWQYASHGNSDNMGSFRISADGSRVIGWGWRPDGKAPTFTETDEKARDLLDFRFLEGRVSYRAIKVPRGTFDLEVLRRTAGLPM